MKRGCIKTTVFVILSAWISIVVGCKEKVADAAAEAPPQAQVVGDVNVANWAVGDPSKYPVVRAQSYEAFPRLQVTGIVTPDIARTVPVVSLASGRVVEIKARLGDEVKKGQVLLRVRSDDISGSFATYQSAVADEVLAKAQWNRAQELYAHGAIALNDMEIAKDTEEKAKIAVDAAAEHLSLLGSSTEHPSGIVDLVAPVSGVITDQQVTNAAGVQSLGTSPFTISDLSYLWIVCDVYENNIPDVRIGDLADVSINAYPGMLLKGTVNNIGLDPNIRTAKVRIEVRNPGTLRIGMFATTTFASEKKEVHTAIPAAAKLHLHDREWVYVPEPGNKFQRVEVISGNALPNGMQEILSGITPGQQVVLNTLALQNEIDNE